MLILSTDSSGNFKDGQVHGYNHPSEYYT